MLILEERQLGYGRKRVNDLRRKMSINRLMASIFVFVLALTVGCSANKYEPSPISNQKYSLDKVNKNIEKVQPGMSKLEVLAILGSPAVRETDSWQYLPERGGYVVPTKALHVEFENSRVVGHRYVPIVLGGQIE
jgi:outer membrane protein assembly factor BamE (lipoprotein component of BamABCDE complex)